MRSPPRTPLQAPPPPNPLQLLAEAGLAAKKSWGQNFLLDQHVLAAIAELAAATDDTVVELGAGLGALTYHLLMQGARVVAIERDRELAPLLRRAFAWASELEVVEADAARLDYAELAGRLGGALTVAGNLPYQLSSRILVSLADARPHVTRAVLLLQREVAERLAAAPGSRAYGLLTVLVQRRLTARIERIVGPGAFYPPPKVHSAVVSLAALATAPGPEVDHALVATARAAFQARRKTLKNALAIAWRLDAAMLVEPLQQAGIAAEARPETLAVSDFARLGAELVAAGVLPAAASGAN